MATGWGMGMEFGMTMSMEFDPTASSPAAAPPPPPSPYMYGLPSADTLRIEDLLDFSNNDLLLPSSTNAADPHTHLLPPPTPMPSTPTPTGRTFTAADYTAQFHNYHHPQLSSSIPSIPYEEAAELEWLSQFVEDSFSDAPYPASAANPRLPAPGRGARSKRASPQQGNLSNTWSALSPAAAAAPPSSSTATTSSSSSSSSEFQHQKTRGRGEESGGAGGGGGGRRCCTHCASEKTPQWRTGPLGPKTLCNACGVRYKSGRLVPEYRPAASPTFVLTHHSNSHRKVMELRRQKEHLLHPSTSSSAAAAAASDRLLFHDYEVC